MQFRDRYDIVNLLGRGTTASVYFVRDKHLNVHWAAKVFDTSGFEMTDWLCMEHEIELLKRIRSLYLPRIVDLYREEHRTYVVMDYMEGVPLDRYIQRYGAVGEVLTVQWMSELCDMIDQLHQMQPTIVYCDLKPENILVQKDGHLGLVDLGSARSLQTTPNANLPFTGTPGFCAPELFLTEENPYNLQDTTWHPATCSPLSIVADIYSIGAVGIFLLGGISQVSLELLEGRISRSLFGILQKCLAPVSSRIDTCNRLKEALQKLC